MVIQGSFDVALHSHSGFEAMLTVTVPPPAPTDVVVGWTLYVQPCDWLTEKDCPATTAVPVRDLPEVAATVAVTAADPLPAAGDSESHGTLLEAVQGQDAAAVIAMAAVVPDAPAVMDAGLIA
jgi:hypothetical protein